MIVRNTSLPEVLLIEPEIHGDHRGFFMETYNQLEYSQAGIDAKFVQDNHSGSGQGILRGLHYQIRQPQGKLLRVVAGEIYDVAVDIRRSSPTFGQWTGNVLTAQNKMQLWVPVGFAHGAYVLSEWAELLYKTTDFYAPEWERSIIWNDPELGIPWPLVDGKSPILSTKDALGSLLKDAELFD